MYIHNEAELIMVFNTKIIPKLLSLLSQDVSRIMKQVLVSSKICVSTMDDFAKYVTIRNNKIESIIYVDFDAMSQAESQPPNFRNVGVGARGGSGLVEWGRFTNTFRGSANYVGDTRWDGELITLRLAEWLEGDDSASGNLVGNQPLTPNLWFTKTAQEVKSKMPNLIKRHLSEMGF